MQRLLHTALAGLMLVFLTSSAGCSIASFGLLFVDFDSNAVEGIRLWKFDGAAWQRDLTIAFGDVVEYRGDEYLSYQFDDKGSGEIGVEMMSRLERGADGVGLRFGLVPLDEGDYKISAFNEVGESALSAGTYSQ